jgi:hypothetical protein
VDDEYCGGFAFDDSGDQCGAVFQGVGESVVAAPLAYITGEGGMFLATDGHR